MKKITLLIALLLSIVANAQRFEWVSTAGYEGVANSYNGAIAIARDSQGNLYTLDSANATQQCQGMTANPAGGTSIFLYKFNALGEIVYMKPIGTNFKPLNLVVGENDNVYVLGSLMGTSEIQINNETFIDTENRNYIFKLDPDGDLIWKVKNNVSFGNFKEASMLLYSNNHIYFQTSGLSISKLNTDGEFVATLTADNFTSNTSATGVFFRGAGVLSNGDLVFSATSRGTITYGTNVLNPTYNSFLHVAMLTIRTTENLSFVWANYTNGLRDPDKNVIPIAVGNDDGIYLGLQVSGTVTAGSDTIISEDTSGTTIGGILKMDADGNKIWVKSTTNNLQSWSFLNNPDGSGILCGGQIFGFQPIALGQTSVNPANGNSFIAKIDYNGVFQNSFAFSQGPIGSYVRSLATDNLGVFYVGGILNNSTSPIFSCVSREGNTGLYLGKFTEEPDTAPEPTITANGSALTASPEFDGNMQWFLNDDPIDGATNQTFTATTAGDYTVSYSYVNACVKTSTVVAVAFQTFNFIPQKVAAGGNHTLFICEDGTVKATGSNILGQFGDGTNNNTLLPVSVSGLTNVVQISSIGQYTLFLKDDGTVWGTGYNEFGQLGNGTTESTNVPIQIQSLSGIVKIIAGHYDSLFLKNDGTVWGCGRNFSGELGNGNALQQNTPQQVINVSNVIDIAGGDGHSMFLQSDGTVKSCGGNQDGALGLGNVGWASRIIPELVDIQNVASIGAGFRQSIFVKQDGTVWASGINTYGKLGFGGTDSQWSPGQVNNLTGIISAVGAQYHTLYLKNDGTVWGTGYNAYGQLGDGTNIDQGAAVQALNLTDVSGIAASGYYHSAFYKSNNTFYTCGQNGGALGDGNTLPQNTPVLVIDNCNALSTETVNATTLTLFPNPSNGILYIASDKLETVSVEIYDMNGRIVFSDKNFNTENTINIHHLQAGMYLVKLIGDDAQRVQKIIKY